MLKRDNLCLILFPSRFCGYTKRTEKPNGNVPHMFYNDDSRDCSPRQENKMKTSNGEKITRIARILWRVNLVLVVIAVIASTVLCVWTNSYYYHGWHGPSFGDGVAIFLVCALGGAFEILIAYITRVILEGFGELISDTSEIKEMLKKGE